jgi:predicted nucleic acid-binding protein
MSAVLVDSNVILDLLTDDPLWFDRSAAALSAAAESSSLVINPIIFAEVSIGFTTVEAIEAALPLPMFRREPLPWAAAFLAGKAFLAYRRRGGVRRSPLPDFFIGAHAAVAGYQLLTRDTDRYQSYFPSLALIVP